MAAPSHIRGQVIADERRSWTRKCWDDLIGFFRRLMDEKGFQTALNAYWDAETPREEWIARAWLRRYGGPWD